MTAEPAGVFPDKFTLTIQRNPVLGWIVTSDAHRGFMFSILEWEGLPEGLRKVPEALCEILVAQMDADREAPAL